MNTYNIGAKIRKLRLARSFTLQVVAQETGLSPALISQIENNKVSPSIATLSEIARCFGIKIGFLFEEEEAWQRFEVVRAGERKAVLRSISRVGVYQGSVREPLSSLKRYKKMEPLLIFSAGHTLEESPHSHEGEEFIFVLRGNTELLLDEHRVVLSEGDSIHFDATLKHRLLARDEEVTVLAVVSR